MNRILRFAAVLLFAGAGCSHGPIIATPGSAGDAQIALWSAASPSIIQSGQTGVWRYFAYPAVVNQQLGIVVGPDKNMWIAENTSALIRVTMKANIKVFNPIVAPFGGVNLQVYPAGMVLGPDGRFWMTDSYSYSYADGFIAAVTTSGSATVYQTPGERAITSQLVVGPDGNIWVPLNSHIARITTSGVITEYAYKTPNSDGGEIAVGPDGAIWFTEYFNGIIGRIVPGSSTVTEYPIAGAGGFPCHLYGLVNGGDGNLYAVGANCLVADTYELLKIDSLGKATAQAALPVQPPFPYGTMRGPDGNIWIPSENDQEIMRYSPKLAKFVTTIPSPSTIECYSGVLATGPDGNVWEAGIAKGVSIYLRFILTVTPTSLTFTSTGQSKTLQATETGNPTLTAVTSNSAVATVVPGSTFNSFTVTSHAVGKAIITVQDQKKNYFQVPTTVQ